MRRQEDIKNLEVRSKLLHKTIGSKIYPLLVPKDAPPAFTNEPESKTSNLGTDWGEVLDEYFIAAKQIDDLQHEIKSVFSVHIPVPRKVFEEGFSAFSIPQVMSTMAPKEDKILLVIGENSRKYGTAPEQKHLERRLVEEHNDRMERVLEQFVVQVESWRSNVKAAKAAESEQIRDEAMRARKRKREARAGHAAGGSTNVCV